MHCSCSIHPPNLSPLQSPLQTTDVSSKNGPSPRPHPLLASILGITKHSCPSDKNKTHQSSHSPTPLLSYNYNSATLPSLMDMFTKGGNRSCQSSSKRNRAYSFWKSCAPFISLKRTTTGCSDSSSAVAWCTVRRNNTIYSTANGAPNQDAPPNSPTSTRLCLTKSRASLAPHSHLTRNPRQRCKSLLRPNCYGPGTHAVPEAWRATICLHDGCCRSPYRYVLDQDRLWHL
jgi:hypothetical protein